METIIAALIGAVFGVLSGVITSLAGRRKNDADAAGAITEAATQLVEPLSRRVDELEEELKVLRPLSKRVDAQDAELKLLRPLPEKLRRLLIGINRLVDQIRCLGHEPVWVPEHESE